MFGGTYMSYHEAHVLSNLYLATNSFGLAMDLFLAMLQCAEVYCPSIEEIYILARKLDWLYHNHLGRDNDANHGSYNRYAQMVRSIEELWAIQQDDNQHMIISEPSAFPKWKL